MLSMILLEIADERGRQAQRFGHTAQADFDAYFSADNGRTRLANVAAKFADGARDHMSVGSLKAARTYALRAAATNAAMIELIDRVIEHTAAPAKDEGKAA